MRNRLGAALIAVIVLPLTLAACGESTSEPAPTTTSHSTTTPHATSTRSTTSAPSSTTFVPQAGNGSSAGSNGASVPAPRSDGTDLPCEGTICTNPNHGAGSDPNANGGAVMQNPNGDGTDVPCEGTICTNPNHGAGG